MDPTQIAPRFSLRLPMRYRPTGDSRWRPTITENLSSSGARFVAFEELSPGTRIEVEISMTATLLKPSRVRTLSEIVRQTAEDPTREVQPHMTAVRHLEYRMEADDPDVEQFARTGSPPTA
jgi:hypothetical protein